MAVGCAVAILAPTWVQLRVLELPVSVRWTFIAIAMFVFSVAHFRKLWAPLVLTDLLVAGMVVAHVSSEFFHDGFSFLVPIRAYCEWALPYVAGRYAMMNHRHFALIGSAFAVVGLIIGFAATFESLTGLNIWETVFIDAGDEVKRPMGKRFGLFFRAHGPFQHPIFLGIVMLLMAPWSAMLLAIRKSRWETGLGILGMIGSLLGVMASVSRGPILALIIAVVCGLCIWHRYVRYSVAVVLLSGIGLVVAFPQAVMDLADSTENSELRGKPVEFDGEVEVYTGTRARIFVWRVYGPLVLRGGLLGFGNEAASTFPPNIPGLPPEVKAREILGYVDNSYLLTGLRFGIIGCTIFSLLVVTSIVASFGLMRNGSALFFPHESFVFAAFSATMIAVALEILTVFSSYDFIFWLLLTIGCIAGMQSAVRVEMRPSRIRRSKHR